MFQTAKTLENALKDRALSDITREKIMQALDYEEAKALFSTSTVSDSISCALIVNDPLASVESLLLIDEMSQGRGRASSRLSMCDSQNLMTSDMSGEELQYALKGTIDSEDSIDSY